MAPRCHRYRKVDGIRKSAQAKIISVDSTSTRRPHGTLGRPRQGAVHPQANGICSAPGCVRGRCMRRRMPPRPYQHDNQGGWREVGHIIPPVKTPDSCGLSEMRLARCRARCRHYRSGGTAPPDGAAQASPRVRAMGALHDTSGRLQVRSKACAGRSRRRGQVWGAPANAARLGHRNNEHGLDGLADQPRDGRPPKLGAEKKAEPIRLVLDGPAPEVRVERVWLYLKERFLSRRLHGRLRDNGRCRMQGLEAFHGAGRPHQIASGAHPS